MILQALGPTSSSAFAAPMGLGCQRCELLELCGGTTDFDCYASCCGKHATCTLACPHAHGFARVMQDAGGLAMKSRYSITQMGETLPPYIPHIHHASCRAGRSSSPIAALTTFDVSAPNAVNRLTNAADLRRSFGLRDDARIILLSVAKDNRLEHHWRYSQAQRLAQYLSTLGISHITAPNFSFTLNEPRAEHLVNRSRSLCEAERMSAAGLSVIPHVNAFNQKDWTCWRDFLRDHPHLSMMCQEFQTGLANGKRARWHIHQMCNVEQALGRGLHLIAAGGRRHLPLLIELSAVTIIDANPFLKTQMRRQFIDGRWRRVTTAPGMPLDQLLDENISAYASYVKGRVRQLRQLGPAQPERESVSTDAAHHPRSASDLQMSLWPKSA